MASSSSSSASSASSASGVVAFEAVGPVAIGAGEIEWGKRIGGGCFGHVYSGVCRGVPVAIKKLFRQSLDPKSLVAFQHEVQIARSVARRSLNPNIQCPMSNV
jgi:predicted Ser/Thr protein kinase